MMEITEEMILAFLQAWHTTAEETGHAYPDDAAMRAGLQAAVGDKLERLAALEAFMDEEAIQEALRVWEEAKEDEAQMFRPKH
jgi:hypothetical protein